MRRQKRTRLIRWAVRLGMPLVLAVAGCPPPEHPDPNDDDDATMGDDDDSAGDDDVTGDDDVQEDYGPRSDDGSAPLHPDLVD